MVGADTPKSRNPERRRIPKSELPTAKRRALLSPSGLPPFGIRRRMEFSAVRLTQCHILRPFHDHDVVPLDHGHEEALELTLPELALVELRLQRLA